MTLLFGVVLALAFATHAEAASRICRQLKAELAALHKRGGASEQRRYDAAIAKQNGELAKARAQARDAGCGFSLFGSGISQCAALNTAIDRMNANLDTLQRKRARMAGAAPRRDRGKITAALEANDCNGTQAAEKRARSDDAPDEEEADAGAPGLEAALNAGFVAAPHGEVRTLCVRTCDGYFFPMSNAATASDFQRDQSRCEASCPGTQMQVFYTRGAGDDPAVMTSSATGRPYSELPTAFLYKKLGQPIPQGCGCNAAQNFGIVAGNPPAAASQTQSEASSPYLPVPATKPDPADDPETLANAAGGLDAEAIRQLVKKPDPSPVSALPPEQRKVRVVGPTFLPDPGAAIDLRAPARKPSP